MKVQFNPAQRTNKELAHAIGGILGAKPEYLRAPSFAYKIGDFTVDRDGALSFGAEDAPETETHDLLNRLAERGFYPVKPEEPVGGSEEYVNATEEPESPADSEEEAINPSVRVPLADFNGMTLHNLEKLIAGHATLLKKATGAESLPIERKDDEWLVFPWFTPTDAAETAVYKQLIAAICEAAKKQKRVLVTDKLYENEKCAFRRFLLRLGFIGPEYAPARKYLLAKFQGNAAFKSCCGKPQGKSAD